jgi:hypothetical protein
VARGRPRVTSKEKFFVRSYDYRNVWLRLIGPGRVAVQSIFERPETHEPITSHSYATARRW